MQLNKKLISDLCKTPHDQTYLTDAQFNELMSPADRDKILSSGFWSASHEVTPALDNFPLFISALKYNFCCIPVNFPV